MILTDIFHISYEKNYCIENGSGMMFINNCDMPLCIIEENYCLLTIKCGSHSLHSNNKKLYLNSIPAS